MTVTIRVPSLRSLALILIGAALGATLITPVAARVAPSAVEPAAIQTRVASCAGVTFVPADDSAEYFNRGPLRYIRHDVGSRIFRCDPGLPHRAVVTKVRFTLGRDFYPTGYDYECMLRRSGLTVATANTHETIAQVPAVPPRTTVESPYVARMSTTDITNGAVDNANFSYWLECRLPGPPEEGPQLNGIYGADVTYTISSANG